MSEICKGCGKKISLFLGNIPSHLLICKAEEYDLPAENYCDKCLTKKLSEVIESREDTFPLVLKETFDHKTDDILDKIIVSAEPKPADYEDFGFVTGYSIIGTGPIANIMSEFTDFFGKESNTYRKK